MDISKAKERLRAYQTMQRDLDNQVERLERLTAQLETPGSPSLTGMPKATGYIESRMTIMIARKVDLEKQIEQAIARERTEREGIERVVCMMERPDEKAIIRLRYLDDAKWTEINEVLHGKRDDFKDKTDDYLRQTYRKHGTALVSFAEAGGGGEP